MKSIPFLLAALLTISTLHAADDARVAKLTAADDERVAATLKADKARMTAIYSDDLHYAHSSGVVDTKTSYIDTLTSGRTKYQIVDYQDRKFTFPAPGMAIMTGRVRIKAMTVNGETDSPMSYLAVWREEQGHWRFLAWQSCKLPPAAPASK